MASTEKAMKGQDDSVRSPFEKQIPTSTSAKKHGTSLFKARDATGAKEFSGSSAAFRSKDFASSGQKNAFASQNAREARQKDQMAAKLFRVPENKLGSQTSPAAGKDFNQGGEVFPTGENPDAGRAMKKETKPVILPPEKPSYSEDDVKRLLNKS